MVRVLEWKEALVKDVIDAHVITSGTVLEIGPGGGRWSKVLADRADKLILVDLTEQSLTVCKEFLCNYNNCVFYRSAGNELPFIKDSSIDYVWSFDVFVHIAPSDVECYLKECSRIFKPGAVGIIHHSINGSNKNGFRSSLTNSLFKKFLAADNLELVSQFDKWGRHKQFSLSSGDMISVFRKS